MAYPIHAAAQQVPRGVPPAGTMNVSPALQPPDSLINLISGQGADALQQVKRIDDILGELAADGDLGSPAKKKSVDALLKIRKALTANLDPDATNKVEDYRIKAEKVQTVRKRLLSELKKGKWNPEVLEKLAGRGADGKPTGPQSFLVSAMQQNVRGAEPAFYEIDTAHTEAIDRRTKQTVNILKKQAEQAGASIYDPIQMEKDVKAAVTQSGGVPSSEIRQRILNTQTQNQAVLARMVEEMDTYEATKVKPRWLGGDVETPTLDEDIAAVLGDDVDADGKPIAGTGRKFKNAKHAAKAVYEKRVADAKAAQAKIDATRKGRIIKGGLAAVAIPTILTLLGKLGGDSKKESGPDPRVIQQLLAQQMMQQKAGLEMDGKQLMNLNRMLSALQKMKDIQGAQVLPAASPRIF